MYCGQETAFFSTDKGLFVCGNNEDGNLGLAEMPIVSEITEIPHFYEQYGNVRSISCGENHTVILTNQKILGLGNNKGRQLGEISETSGLIFEIKIGCRFEEIVGISCGRDHTIIYTKDKVFVSGANYYGQLGLGDYCDRKEFVEICNFHKRFGNVMRIVSGDFFTLYHTENGLYVSGRNESGELGLDHKNNCCDLVKIEVEHNTILNIVCGNSHILIQTETELIVFGANYCGVLGLGSKIGSFGPNSIDFSKGYGNIENISAGAFSSIITTDKGVYSFGRNDFGELGLSDRMHRNVPTEIEDFYQLYGYPIKISSGWQFTFIETDRGIFRCGINDYGQLGTGSLDSVPLLTEISQFKERFGSIVNLNCRKIKSAKF